MRITTLVFLLFCVIASCETSDRKNANQTTEDSLKADEPESRATREDFITYTNNQFNVSVDYPENWHISESKVGGQSLVINIYDPENNADEEIPLKIHASEDISFVSIFPQGYGTELPFGKQSTWAETEDHLSLNFDVHPEESKVYQLNNGRVWGYFLKPENTPGSWYDGFIFAQVAVDSFLVTCHDEVAGDSLSMEECDPLTGDLIRRYGEIDQRDQEIIKQILSSIELTSKGRGKESIANLIKVEQPYPNEDVRLPMDISGKAKGTWYFEGSFPIRLIDKDGKVLAKVTAKAQGEWMTEDWVPFKATIENINTPDDERGYLVFQKDNPSGKPELDREFKLPVLFPPK